MIHVAILIKPYLDLVLTGRKAIECRLTRTNRVPYRAVEVEDRLYFKQSAGPFRATAVADEVLSLEGLTPKRIRDLKREYNDGILGEPAFWDWKSDARFGTLIWLRDVEPVAYGPSVDPQRGIAWLLLDDRHDVYPDCVDRSGAFALPWSADESASAPPGVITIPLTAGNIRHAHVSVRRARERFPRWAFGGRTRMERARRSLVIEFEDGSAFETDIVDEKHIFRARRPWRRWFREERAEPGDRVLFFPLGAGRYLARLRRSSESAPTAQRSTTSAPASASASATASTKKS